MDQELTANAGKWHHGIPAVGLSRLNEISNELGRHADETQKFLARKQVEVGRLLLEAREKFKGDNEFGKWRAEHTPIGSRQTANRLMNLAKQVGDGRITDKLLDSLPTATLFELLPASEESKAAIEKKLDDGEKVTAKVVRETRRATETSDTPEDPSPRPETATSDPTRHIPPNPAAAPDDERGKGFRKFAFKGDYSRRTMDDDMYDLAGQIVEFEPELARALIVALKERLGE